MRHRKKLKRLSRESSHRKAMLANMANELILNKRIRTTTPKAKALRMYVEPLITKSKTDNTHSRRTVFSYLKNKYAVNELFREISPKVAEREGGYTRILKLGNRLGDNAEMSMIELVDYNENMLKDKEEKKKASKRRTRRGGRRKSSAAEGSQQETATAEKETQTEEKPEQEDDSQKQAANQAAQQSENQKGEQADEQKKDDTDTSEEQKND